MLEKQHEIRIHIDQKLYRSPNPTTGAALYELGGVSPDQELYRELTGHMEDEVIPNDSSSVSLKEGDHFHTGRKEITIIVNGKKKTVTKKKLTFDEIVSLAFDPVPTGPNVMFTITYQSGPPANPEGSLLEGASVKIKEGMIFDVTPTDKS